jgi:hypothetical protein
MAGIRIGMLALALLLAGALAACGSSSGGNGGDTATTQSTASAAAPAPRDAREQALADARAVNLRPADVPELPAKPGEQHPNQAAAEESIARCEGVSLKGRENVRVFSPNFGDPAKERVASLVTIDVAHPGKTLDRRSLAIAASRRGAYCNARYIGQTASDEGAEKIDVTPLAHPLHGAGFVALRFRVSFQAQGASGTGGPHHFTVFEDVLLDYVGAMQVELSSSRVGAPFPSALQERLWRTLEARARTLSSQ